MTSERPPGTDGLKLAVMQPYFLPYVGYFQLIDSADLFVLYDDVQFIKQGWVNRNSLLLAGMPHMITIPVVGNQLSGPICGVQISPKPVGWRKKILRTIESAYSKSTSFESIRPMVTDWLQEAEAGIAALNHRVIRDVCNYLGIATRIVLSSERYTNSHLQREARLVDLCRIEGASRYINSPGGRSLYHPAMFTPHGIRLGFLRPRLAEYRQNHHAFTPGLSILDLLMHTTRAEARQCLGGYTIEC